MAENRRFKPLMPTTVLATISSARPDPIGTKRRRRVSRVSTSDGSDAIENIERLQKKYKIEVENPSTYPSLKAPPQPPIDRPEPDVVFNESKIRREMERRQFQPLSEDWYWRIQQEVYKLDEEEWGALAVDLDYLKLLKRDWRYMIKMLDIIDRNSAGVITVQELGHVPMTIDDYYIHMACEYRNKAIARTLKGGDLAGDTPTRQKVSCIAIDSQKFLWDMNKGRNWEDENGYNVFDKDTGKLRFDEQDFPAAWRKVKDSLAQYDDETFMNLDYVLIPFEFDGYHTTLMGLAPKQRFCFLIDNSGANEPRYRQHPRIDRSSYYHNMYQMSLLEAIVYDRYGKGPPPYGNFTDTPKLPLFGEWSYRTDHAVAANRTTDNSPNAPRQSDGYNCGMMTLTNATNLIFGYDMLCFSCQPDMSDVPVRNGKRVRIMAEFLNGGFNKPFDYPLFKIPTKLKGITTDSSYLHNIAPLPPPPLRERDLSEDDEPKPSESEADEESDEDEDEDSQDAADRQDASRAAAELIGEFRRDQIQRGQESARTKVKKANKGKKVRWSGQPASDPEPYKPIPSEWPNIEPIETLWPEQMDPYRTGKCGFIYEIKRPRFSGPRWNRYELKRAAMLNQMTNWEIWERMPLHMFRAWMENTMAGREDEELTPWVDALVLDGSVNGVLPETDRPETALRR